MPYSTIKWIADVCSKPLELHSYIISMDNFLNSHMLLSNITEDFDYDNELCKIKESCALDEINFIEIIQKNKILQQKYFDYKSNKPMDDISIQKVDLYNLLIEMRNKLESISKKQNDQKKKSAKQSKKNLKLVIIKEKTNYESKKVFENKTFETKFTNDVKRNKDLNLCIEKSKKKSLYNRLGCNRSCNLKEISSKYKSISRVLHPDKNGGLIPDHLQVVDEAYKNVTYAFKILSNFKEKYDSLLDKYNGDLEQIDEVMKLDCFEE